MVLLALSTWFLGSFLLRLYCRTSLVIGSKTTLKLNIRVENRNEPAYLCQVRMKLPTDIEIVRISSKCDLSEDRLYRCLVDNVLQPNTFVRILMHKHYKILNAILIPERINL